MKLIYFALAMVLSVGLVTGAGAAPISWSNPSGYTSTFHWFDGASGDGLWGDPDVNDLGFFFNNMDPGFKAEATEPSAQTTLSLMSVSLDTYASGPITELHVYEWGQFSGNIEDVDQTTGSLALTVYVPSFTMVDIPLNFEFNLDGTWSAYCELDVASLGEPFASSGLMDFDLDVSNYLVAEPVTQGGTAMIQKLGGKVIVPEPATLLLAVCGLAMISLRRS